MKPQPPQAGDMYVHCGHEARLQQHWLTLNEGTTVIDAEGTLLRPKWQVLCVECFKNHAEQPEKCPIGFAAYVATTPKIQQSN